MFVFRNSLVLLLLGFLLCILWLYVYFRFRLYRLFSIGLWPILSFLLVLVCVLFRGLYIKFLLLYCPQVGVAEDVVGDGRTEEARILVVLMHQEEVVATPGEDLLEEVVATQITTMIGDMAMISVADLVVVVMEAEVVIGRIEAGTVREEDKIAEAAKNLEKPHLVSYI